MSAAPLRAATGFVRLSRRLRGTPARAMTLVEVMFSVAVLTIAVGGLLATFLQSRRLTEGSVFQNAALTIVQGYLEQIKNMDITQMVGGADTTGQPLINTASFSIPVYYDRNTPDALQTSTGTPPSITAINNGVTPAGVVDNLKTFDMEKDLSQVNMTGTDTLSYATTAQVAWATVWPHANNYPVTSNGADVLINVGKNDLHLNVWVWITDVSVAAQRSSKIYSITLLYTWAYNDGGRTRYVSDVIRCLRSAVTTM